MSLWIKGMMWSLVIAGVVAIKWMIYFYISGDVPLTKDFIIISRWRDVLGGPIIVVCSVILIICFDGVEKLYIKQIIVSLFISVFLSGFFIGLIFYGLIPGVYLGISFIFAMIIILISLLFIGILLIIGGLLKEFGNKKKILKVK